MLKEASKLMLLPLLVLTACASNNEDKAAADQLVAEASAALNRGDFAAAEAMLDSVSAQYPKQIEAGRAALALRPKVMERKTEQEIADLQTVMQYSGAYVDSISQYFTVVPRSEEVFEPYLIHKDVPANWRDKNTAISRLSNSGSFYVISSLQGNSAHHTALQLSKDGISVTSGSVTYDATDRLMSESVRFPSEAADTLGAFAVQMDGRGPVMLTFVGGKKQPTATLSAKEVHAMADTYRMGLAMQTLNSGARRLEQLKAKLQLARDQAARTSAE
ncbi:MAG: hypothetical protein NC301_02645 [Bacteroides sp.]|nr:hypothetical protein [Bacteroides sp.]MCM1379630.1 hypothetical protein [Bacteroides sp.]MCM1445988.1 hypothetical protein [Prevotella sp.]